MMPLIRLMVARVVQFSKTQYTKEGIYLEFLVDVLRPVLVEEGCAIDIFSHQVFEIVPMEDGYIGIDTLGQLDREALYAYGLYEASFPEQWLPSFFSKALETYHWYYEEYKMPKQKKNASAKILSLEEIRKKREISKKDPKNS